MKALAYSTTSGPRSSRPRPPRFLTAPNHGGFVPTERLLDGPAFSEWAHTPPKHGRQDAKLRLRDTIKRLNQHHKHRSIHFRPDGRGRGIIWEFAPEQAG